MTQTETQSRFNQLFENTNKFNDKGSVKSMKSLEFLQKDNDYDDVDLINSVVYEVEEISNGK